MILHLSASLRRQDLGIGLRPGGLALRALRQVRKTFHHHGYKAPENLKKSCEKGEDARIGFEIALEIEENIKDNLN
jgi:hypothetical protein